MSGRRHRTSRRLSHGEEAMCVSVASCASHLLGFGCAPCMLCKGFRVGVVLVALVSRGPPPDESGRAHHLAGSGRRSVESQFTMAAVFAFMAARCSLSLHGRASTCVVTRGIRDPVGR